MKRKLVVATAYDGMLGFEYAIVAELFGRVRTGLESYTYDFKTCRVERGELTSSHGQALRPELGLNELVRAHTIIVPGWRSPDEVPRPAFLRGLQDAWKCGARIVSVCSGAFVLGHAGLLNGRRVTAHWMHTDQLARMFPKAKVVRDSLYVHDGRILSSAGSSAGLDLCLSIIRKDFGVEVANTLARRIVAPTHREGGQSQYVEQTVLSTDDEDFGPILDWMTKNLSRPIAMEDVAERFCLTLRTFQRRFRTLTGHSPLSWINRQRVDKARALLEATDLSIEQIADQAGFGSAANLRKHFDRVLGTTPSAYRSAFSSE